MLSFNLYSHLEQEAKLLVLFKLLIFLALSCTKKRKHVAILIAKLIQNVVANILANMLTFKGKTWSLNLKLTKCAIKETYYLNINNKKKASTYSERE